MAALALISVLVSAGLAELALRMMAPQPASWLALYRPHPTRGFHALLPDSHVSIDTGETRWVVRTDPMGFRIGDAPRPPAECTALWLGDSFAFGHGVDWEDSLIGLVETRVPRVRQVNAAVPGYGPTQYREVLEQLLQEGGRFEHVVVVTYVGNDFHDGLWDKDVPVHDGVIGHRGDLKSLLKSHLHLYRLVSAAYHQLAPAPESPHQRTLDELADPDAWTSGALARAEEIFVLEMTRIRDLARSGGAEVGFVIVPTQEAVAAARDSASDGERLALLPVSKARSALARLDSPVFDATDALAADPAAPLYFRFDGHLDREGNRRVADGLLAKWTLDCPGSPKPLHRDQGDPALGTRAQTPSTRR